MTDTELVRALECGGIANEDFHHLSHLHVAWVYLSESSGVDEAVDKMRNTPEEICHLRWQARKVS